MSETFYNAIEHSAGEKLFFDGADNRFQKRGFDEEAFKAERHWTPDPKKPGEVHPAVAREQAHLRGIAAAEKVLGREVKAVPVGPRVWGALQTDRTQASEHQLPLANVTTMSEYADRRDAARAA
jgi:hypothetical protein